MKNICYYIILNLVAFVHASTPSFSQIIFQKSLHNQDERITDFDFVNDSSMIFTGFWKNCGVCINNPILVKTDNNFNVLWSYKYFDNSATWQLIKTNDGFIMFGTKNGIVDLNHLLIKTDLNGDVVWSKSIGSLYDEQGKVLKSQSGFLIGSRISLTDSIGNLIHILNLIRLDELGSVLWNRSYNFGKDAAVSGLIELNDSSIIVLGSLLESDTSSLKGLFVKVNYMGDILAVKKYNTIGHHNYFSTFPLFVDSLIFAAGHFEDNSFFHPVLISLNDTGSIIVANSYRQPGGSPYPFDIIKKSNNEFMMTLGQGMIVTDQGGNFIEAHSYIPNLPANSNYYQIKAANDSGYYLAGYNTGMNDMYLVKTDSLYHGGCGYYNVNLNTMQEFYISEDCNYQEMFLNVSDSTIQIIKDPLVLSSTTFCITATGHSTHSNFDTILVYPIPTIDYLYLEMGCLSCMDALFVKILNVEGKVIQEIEQTGPKIFIDLSGNKPGIYFIQVKSNKFAKYFKTIKI